MFLKKGRAERERMKEKKKQEQCEDWMKGLYKSVMPFSTVRSV